MSSINKVILFLIILMSFGELFSQTKDTLPHDRNKIILDANAVKIALQTSDFAFYEIGIFKMYTTNYMRSIKNFGPSASIGMQFEGNHLINPKISFEYHFLLIGAKTSFVNYTNFKENQVAFSTEIGLSIFGMICVMYGHNFPITQNKNLIYTPNIVTFSVNMPFYKKNYLPKSR